LKRMKSIYGEFFVRAIREQRANAAIIDCWQQQRYATRHTGCCFSLDEQEQ
jgi:hypothetical protein